MITTLTTGVGGLGGDYNTHHWGGWTRRQLAQHEKFPVMGVRPEQVI